MSTGTEPVERSGTPTTPDSRVFRISKLGGHRQPSLVKAWPGCPLSGFGEGSGVFASFSFDDNDNEDFDVIPLSQEKSMSE